MKLDKSNLIAVLVFFGLGIFFGGWLNQVGFQIGSVIKGVELSLASAAVIIAGIALYTWKEQIIYSKKLHAVENLEASFKQLIRDSRNHWSESIDLARDTNQEYNRERLPSFARQTESYLLYVDAWDSFTINTRKKVNDSQLVPDKLQKKLISLFVPIHRDYISNYDPADSDIESSYSSLYIYGLIEIRGYRP